MLTVQREDLATLEAEWREILPRCSGSPVFLSPTWLKTWWEVFAQPSSAHPEPRRREPVEGRERELVLLGARDGSGLTGVAPLMREGTRLSFAGDTNVCDYMDFTCVAGGEPALVSSVLRSLSEEPWQELSLWALREDSAALAALPAACTELRLDISVEEEDVCPQIALPATWDEYVSSLDKKDRHELRRKLRRLPQAGEVGFEALETPQEMEAALDEFVRMYAGSRLDKAAFLTTQQEQFLRRIALALAAEGLAEMTFLTLNGLRVAGVLCFRGPDEVLLYNSGYDPAYREFSVGLLSKAMTLERAIQQGKKRFDFLRGPEPYKYDLGASDLKVFRCVIQRT
jgi:CelD/BcsL family acetyltransferase involved in cellulose biosynthesis